MTPVQSWTVRRDAVRAIKLGLGVLAITGLAMAVMAHHRASAAGTAGWAAAGDMAGARSDHAGTVLADGRVLVVGGADKDHPALASAEVWDPESGMFEATGDLAEARADHTATLLADGRVLVVGGTGADGIALASAEVWDPGTGLFGATGDLAEARSDHTATLLADGRVLVVGGATPFGPALASAEVWDPVSGAFASGGSLVDARSDHTATLLADGRVLVAGGAIADGVALSSAEVWDPQTGISSPATPLTEMRQGHTATLLPDGRVLVIGGYDGIGSYHATAEIRDALDGTFGYGGALADARAFHTATLLPDGRVLVVGGYDGEWLATAEIWDPGTATFGPAGALGTARDLHTAALLPDGRVLVAGGFNGRDLASTEAWDPSGQSIGIIALPEVLPVTAGPIDLAPRASSGLPVLLEVAGACALQETRLVLRDPGTCTVTAFQPGDDTWKPAAPVTITIEVVPAVGGDVSLLPATTLPPTFVAPHTVMRTILDPNRAPSHYFGIWLDAGAMLHAVADADDRAPAVSITEGPTTWATDPELLFWADVDSSGWLAPSAGLYIVRVADTSGGGSPYRYTLTIDTDGPPPLSTLPPEGTPLTGRIELGGHVASEPPGTLVASGAVIHGYLALGRREGYLSIDLTLGDTLVTRSDGQVTLSLAYPSDPATWYPLDGPWLASEPGTYAVRVSAFPLSGGLPFSVSFEVVR